MRRGDRGIVALGLLLVVSAAGACSDDADPGGGAGATTSTSSGTTTTTDTTPAGGAGGGVGASGGAGASDGGAAGAPIVEYYFQGDFEGVGIAESSLTGWGLADVPLVADEYVNNTPPYVLQAITLDPEETGRAVLRSDSVDDDPAEGGTSRAQYTIELYDTVFLDVYHTSHRVWLSPDLDYLTSYGGGISARGVPDWLTIFEIWNGHVDAWDGDIGGACRWSLGLNKAEGAGMPLRFELAAEYMQPESIAYDELWPKQVNATVAVPLGQWVTLDVSLTPGQGASGHLTVTLTPDGGATETIFDISDHTIYPDHPEIPVRAWQPFKLYTSDTVLDFFAADGKRIYAYYNDVAWYKR